MNPIPHAVMAYEGISIAKLAKEKWDFMDHAPQDVYRPQSVQRHHKAATEELQASSEEVQSANEELQSLNKELETSKEGLQSSNKELTTVNEEMCNRNAELDRLNADLNNLQAITHAAILLVGHDLAIRRFTPLAGKTFNLLATDVGRPLSGIKHNLELPHLDHFVTEVIASARVSNREVRDKAGRWYSLRVRPYLTVDNKIEGAVLALVDIDALKRSEQAIKAACDYAEATLRTARDPVVILNADLRVKTANQAFYKTFKTTPLQTEGLLISELGNGQWRNPHLCELLEDILRRNSSFDEFEVAHDFPAIGRRTMLLNCRRLETENASQLILFSIEDVTERLESRAAMKHSEIRYRRLFEAAQDGIISLDPVSRKITDANPFMTQLLGYSREEFIGKELWQIGLLKDEQASHAAFRELQKKGCIRYEDLPLQTKAGEKREVEFVSNLYDEDSHTVIQCNVRDITDRKREKTALEGAKERLAKQAGELERLVRERTSALREAVGELEAFSYSVAHDLRAPLRAVQGYSSNLLEEYADRLDETGKIYLERMARSAIRMDKLIQDVLSYTRIPRGQIPMERVDLDRLLRDLIDTYPDWQPPKAAIQFEGTLPKVFGNEALIAQCLSNLVGNAVKFVSPDTQSQVRIWAESVSNHVRVWIEDNGVGIAQQNHVRIFRMFEQIFPAGQFDGTGIGLTIVRKAVERMGGRVGLESEIGKGSQFWIEFQKARDE